MKDLFLFTASFPYGRGEQFLELEITYLSEKFENIYIIPFQVKTIIDQREVPNNCLVYFLPSNAKSSKVGRLFTLFTSSWFWAETVRSPKSIGSLVEIGMIYCSLGQQYKACLSKITGSFKDSIFYSYWFGGHILGLATIMKELPIVPLISRAHRYDLYEELDDLGYHPFKKFLISRFNRVCSISQDGNEYLKNKYSRIKTDTFRCERLGIKVPKSPKVYEKGNNGKYFISCSHIKAVKNVDKIAQVLKGLGDLCPSEELHWIHIGDGEEEIEKKVAEIITTMPQNVNANLVGALPNSKVLEYYDKENIFLFINLSSSEGIPVSIMEANGRGIPAAATITGGVGELVNKSNGIPLSVEDSSQNIALKIKELIDASPEKYLDMRAEAYNRVNLKFNAEVNYPQFISEVLKK